MSQISTGSGAPDFTLTDGEEDWTLSNARAYGVLLFYMATTLRLHGSLFRS